MHVVRWLFTVKKKKKKSKHESPRGDLREFSYGVKHVLSVHFKWTKNKSERTQDVRVFTRPFRTRFSMVRIPEIRLVYFFSRRE